MERTLRNCPGCKIELHERLEVCEICGYDLEEHCKECEAHHHPDSGITCWKNHQCELCGGKILTNGDRYTEFRIITG